MIENDNLGQDLERNEARNDNENFYDPGAVFGPIELNILERVEQGLNLSFAADNDSRSYTTPLNERDMYEGPKEVIFVTGWVNIDSVYQRYLYGFVCKILLGIALIFCLLYMQQSFTPIAIMLLLINVGHIAKNAYFLYIYRGNNARMRTIFLVELHISLGYAIYFAGFVLLLTKRISTRFFLLFSLPYLALTLFIFFYNADDNLYLSQKKFSVFEGIQLLLIAVKFAQLGAMDWSYTLLFFMTAAIYVTVIGLLLMIILSCSLFGFLYRNLEPWKLKSLIWMTWYYLTSGLIYVYVIKGVISFYGEENPYDIPLIPDYTKYRSPAPDTLLSSGVMLIVLSAINLVMHVLWRRDIKKYLAKVIYKDELRKEVSLRFLTKSFTFKLIQVSTTYFMKPDAAAAKTGPVETPVSVPEVKEAGDKDNMSVKSTQVKKVGSARSENELCVFCYTEKPNMMIDKCGHGGVCKDCMLQYLKSNGSKCPFCKGPIGKLYVLSYDEKDKQFYASGEIKLNNGN